MKLYLILIVGLTLGLSACGGKDVETETLVEGQTTKPVEVLYNEAADALDNEEYRRAKGLFEEVERQYPYSKWATKAQLMSAFAAYQDDKYDEDGVRGG